MCCLPISSLFPQAKNRQAIVPVVDCHFWGVADWQQTNQAAEDMPLFGTKMGLQSDSWSETPSRLVIQTSEFAFPLTHRYPYAVTLPNGISQESIPLLMVQSLTKLSCSRSLRVPKTNCATRSRRRASTTPSKGYQGLEPSSTRSHVRPTAGEPVLEEHHSLMLDSFSLLSFCS